jgi:hypothetical protein
MPLSVSERERLRRLLLGSAFEGESGECRGQVRSQFNLSWCDLLNVDKEPVFGGLQSVLPAGNRHLPDLCLGKGFLPFHDGAELIAATKTEEVLDRLTTKFSGRSRRDAVRGPGKVSAFPRK